jgi:hypothetical protein
MGWIPDSGAGARSPRATDLMESVASEGARVTAEFEVSWPPHPALRRLSALLGHEAAAFARRYRYAGLGRLQLWLDNLNSESDD